ncbi:hypothetical protein KOAAANKH_02568 [Brevundimonas sp. NIBR10]|uniref:hypothetical protein n=1 Tax=Brevundimonas sp. NIBR10 TaxID=3015997 RepID=UPI0022F1D820|nr:hypothetical protein [Brevundimonas sp. NIBR10]WGM47686.1 hypothetical protein KOAAANKH_02568 [Brevundimonas sp. NIBR10]
MTDTPNRNPAWSLDMLVSAGKALASADVTAVGETFGIPASEREAFAYWARAEAGRAVSE